MNIMSKITYIFTLFAMLALVVPTAIAQEIVITGNGAGSNNEVTVTSTQQTNVQQTNTAEVSNNIATDANTGGNTASDNTGENVNIQTGNVETTTQATNTLNYSEANIEPCDCVASFTTKISGNGTGLGNIINNTYVSQTNLSVNQSASVINNLTTNANTGNNTANNNSGNVSITTGNIRALTSVENGPVNVSRIKVTGSASINNILRIANNGVDSVNTINLTSSNNVAVVINNYADFLNNIGLDLNTGGNTANGNVGDVKISTGDIWAEIKVKNLANISDVLIDCGCPKPGEEEPPIIPPGIVNPPTGGGGPGPTGGGSPSPSSAAAAVAAAIEALLPSTGTNWLVLALVGNIMMLFLGAYLRLRSGRSPGLELA
jgi:hypothetical protein